MELALAGMEHDEQERESEVVEDRADRAEYKHEPLDAPVVPARWLTQGLGVDVVGWDVCLGRVADQVIEQDLAGQHRQEGEEQRRPGHAQHVAEVELIPIRMYLSVLADVRLPSRTPCAIVDRLGWRRTMSAAARAT
jgi:hypothetical protein